MSCLRRRVDLVVVGILALLPISLHAAPPTAIVSPSVIAGGAQGARLVIAGTGFSPGCTVSAPADLRIDSVTFLSSARLEVIVSSAAGAPSGPRVLVVRAPGVDVAQAIVTVLPPTGLVGPISVSTAAVVFPQQGSLVSSGDDVYARGFLATSGTGSVVGSWLLDGFPYERFVISASGGEPIPVEAKIPIPAVPMGDHFLQLAIEEPQRVASDPVRLIRVSRTASRLRLIEPEDGFIVGAPTAFRWTLVPGAAAYEVVFSPEEVEGAASLRFRTTQSSWTPSPEDWARLAGRARFWAVRPIFPVEVRGPRTGWNRIAPIPVRVSLVSRSPKTTSRGTRLEWKGGVPGLLYRIVAYPARDPRQIVFSAMTFHESYELRRASLPPGRVDLILRIDAVSLEGRVVGIAEPVSLSLEAAPQGARLASFVPGRRMPEEGSEVASAVLNRWDESDVQIDGTDVSDLVRLWVVPQDAPAPSFPEAASTPSKRPDWRIDASGLVTVISGARADQGDTAHLTISSSGSYDAEPWNAAETADFAFRHDFNEPHQTVQESHNWLGRGSYGNESWRGSASVGYATSTSADQMQLLDTGLARGAAELVARTPYGTVAGFGTFDDQIRGAFSSTLGTQQRLKVASYDAPLAATPFVLRGIYLETEAFADAAIPIAGSRGKAYGGLARWNASPALSVLLEAAHGSSTSGANAETGGNAFRALIAGALGKTSYSLNLHRTESTFTNPASPSFTPGSTPNRTGGEANVTQALGKGYAQLSYTYLMAGALAGSSTEANHHDGGLSFSWPLSSRISSSIAGTYSVDRSDEGMGAAGPLPENHLSQYGGTLTFQETVGMFNLVQSAALAKFDDRITDTNSRTTTFVSLSANGDLLPTLNVSLSTSFTRLDNSISGRNDALQILVQPTWRLTAAGVSVTASASYMQGDSSISPVVTRIEQYQALAQWTPIPLKDHAVLGLSAQWDRNRTSGAVPPAEGSDRQYMATLTLRWGASSAVSTPMVFLPPASRSYPPSRTASLAPIAPVRAATF